MLELARKWQEGTITSEEKLEFDRWYDAFDDTPEIGDAGLKEKMYKTIEEREKIGRPVVVRMGRRTWTVAAAVLLLLGAATWWYNQHPSRQQPVVAKAQRTDAPAIVPGSNKAILTLAGGEQMVLDSAKNGVLARQGATDVVKEKNGALSYQKPGAGRSGAGADSTGAESGAAGAAPTGAAPTPLYNTITTPRGGQYAVTLPDGSKVWLNAASSIRFPTSFTGTTRNVEIKGEAYFEIAANKSMPFKVAVTYPNGKVMDVEVLGTSFNIMAYEEEHLVKTTLIEGAVRVSHYSDEKILHPGQQAQLKPDGVLHTLNNADTGAAIAWKNGRTIFAGEDIQTIMRRVSRWYDIDVEYRGNITERKFTGGIARNSDISVLLKILELNQIHYSVEGKKIVLMP